MALPAGLSTFTLTGGAYTDPTGAVKFAGLTGKLSLTSPLRYNGAEVDGTVSVTIAGDGTFSAGPLVNTSDPAVAAQGVAYRMEWDVGRFADCPGGQRSVTFTVAAGTTTADYDVITPITTTALAGPVGLPFVTSVNGKTGVVTTGDLGIGASFVIHGATASVARPATSLPVVWFGSVSPTNADATLDVYVPVSSDGGAAALASLQAALAAKADLAGGVVPDAELPARLSSTALAGAYVALGQLAASPDLMAVGTITRSATGAATGFSVVWPDGATGTFTGTESTTAPGAIDSYTVTHVAGGTTVTYTQPALTRDSSGNVTARPAMTVA